jgi:hypothetical protein
MYNHPLQKSSSRRGHLTHTPPQAATLRPQSAAAACPQAPASTRCMSRTKIRWEETEVLLGVQPRGSLGVKDNNAAGQERRGEQLRRRCEA